MDAPARADYGVDAPIVVRRLLLAGGAALVAALAFRFTGFFRLSFAALIPALWLLLSAAVMTLGSRVGKLRLRDRLLARIGLRGDEQVLDVGCGHGLLLIAAAKRLTSGKAIGIDVWSQVDQAANRPEATRANARIEGVEARVDVRDGDARALEFPAGAFDVAVSSFALHNIAAATERAQAIREIVRVLKPGGRVGIIDVWSISQYRRIFREIGMEQVRLSWPSFWFVVPAFILTAVKPRQD